MKITGSLFAAALAAVFFTASGVTAATIFTDSFETPRITGSWQVFEDDFGAWESRTGTGIEIQKNGAVGGITAHDGIQYVELDSDRSRGGDRTATTTNSSMTRVLSLGAGTYKLEWFYQPRTNVADDNIISVYLAGLSQGLFDVQIGTVNGIGRTGWERQVSYFTLDGLDNTYALSFRAEGKANSLGGFIDSVSLSQVPLPAGFPLLLAGAAALVLAGRRRRS